MTFYFERHAHNIDTMIEWHAVYDDNGTDMRNKWYTKRCPNK